MEESYCFLIRAVKKDARGKMLALPKDIAVVAISDTIKSKHFVFENIHHSLNLHPELSRYVRSGPTKHRHVTVKFKHGQGDRYKNKLTNEFWYSGQALRPWERPIETLTGNDLFYS